jgi:DNA uptake protein ComE-like DNA-binding protein
VNGKQLAPRRRSSPVLRQVAWASIPIWSIGFLSFVPFLGFAVINRRRRDWVVFGVYLAATIAMIVSLGAVNSSSGAGAAVGGFIVALAGCAAVHTAVLFRPGREQAAVPAGAPTGAPAGALAGPASLEQANREAVARAKSRLERRKEARRMVAAQPDLARDLKIGRPDLPRDYDDGGLVDVNHVPSAVLSAQLGLTPAEATDVLTARERLGRFTSADELCAYTQLSPDRVDELRELMIFT